MYTKLKFSAISNKTKIATPFKIECVLTWTQINFNLFPEKYLQIGCEIIYENQDHLSFTLKKYKKKKKTITVVYSWFFFLHHLHAFIIFSSQSLFTRCNWNGSYFLQINGKFLQGWCRCTKEIHQKGKTFKEII